MNPSDQIRSVGGNAEPVRSAHFVFTSPIKTMLPVTHTASFVL
jgi:hypothetical protein